MCEGTRNAPGDTYAGVQHVDFWSANLPEGLLFVGCTPLRSCRRSLCLVAHTVHPSPSRLRPVFTTDPNTPGFVQLNATNGELVQLQIHVWLPQPIAQSRFNVPEACQKAEVTDAPVSSFPRRFFGL